MTETITPAAALLWLAGLERDCLGEAYNSDEGAGYQATIIADRAHGPWCCNGSGKVPILDLRENVHAVAPTCLPGCLGWSPKQGWDALHSAMHHNGWNSEILWVTEDYREYTGEYMPPFTMKAEERLVVFWKDFPRSCQGEDADDWLAAMKAMKAAGYALYELR